MDNIIEKVRKLLEIATHPATNVNEAATAATRAQELLFKHKLSLADIELESGEKTEEVSRDAVDQEGSRHSEWRNTVMSGLAHGLFCRSILSYGRNADGERVARTILVGKPSDIQTLKYLYGYCCNEINRLCSEQASGRGTRYANSFRLGAAMAIYQAMQAKRKEQEHAEGVKETALAIIKRDDEGNAAYVKANFKTTHVAYRGPSDGEGKKAGATINLNGGGRGLGAPAKQLPSA